MTMMNTDRPAKRHRTIRRAAARSGFSLIEVVACLAIIATVGAMAIPRYGAAVARYRVEAAATRVVAEVHRVRDKSGRAGRSLTISFRGGKNAFLTTYTVGAARESLVWLKAEPYWAVINSVDLGGDTAIVFDGYGAPDSGGTIVVRHGSIASTITIDTAGAATFTRPVQLIPASIVKETAFNAGEIALGFSDDNADRK